jgi:hypothetical protein
MGRFEYDHDATPYWVHAVESHGKSSRCFFFQIISIAGGAAIVSVPPEADAQPAVEIINHFTVA